MKDEKVVSILRQQHKTLDESIHSLARKTADIKKISLQNQEDITVVKAQLTVLKHEMNTRFDQLNLLIRQLSPIANN